ncbi:MAG TPA: hypothetical protein VF701_21675 [Thermoanaerobaculia bacterium]
MTDIDRLWELQSLLSVLNDREKQMAVKPESFAAIDSEYEAANATMAGLNQQLEVLAKERRRMEGELSDQQEILKKYQGQLMQVKNQQQYAAAWKEIDASRKHVKDLEESVMKNMADAEVLQGQLDEKQQSHTELQARYDTAHAEWQHSLADLRKEAEDLRKKVEAVEATIAPRLKAEFHKISKQRQGVAVTRTTGDSCSSCRSRVRPAVAQQIKRGELVFCEGCHRMLYGK